MTKIRGGDKKTGTGTSELQNHLKRKDGVRNFIRGRKESYSTKRGIEGDGRRKGKRQSRKKSYQECENLHGAHLLAYPYAREGKLKNRNDNKSTPMPRKRDPLMAHVGDGYRETMKRGKRKMAEKRKRLARVSIGLPTGNGRRAIQTTGGGQRKRGARARVLGVKERVRRQRALKVAWLSVGTREPEREKKAMGQKEWEA